MIDTLATDFQSLAASNFSRYQTVNVSWEMKGSHDYTFKAGDKMLDDGRKTNLHTIKASMMLPIIKNRKFSLYASMEYDRYSFDTSCPTVFRHDDYNRFQGGLSASYMTSLFDRPLFLMANLTADGWEDGFGTVQGFMVASLILKRNADTQLSLGLAGTTIGKIPVVPAFTYWHRFANPNWSVDIAFPRQIYLRHQMKKHRLSIGSQFAMEGFYLHTSLSELQSTYYYREIALKPEVLYEYIISKHVYISADAGISVPLRGGLYTKSRKDAELSGEDVRQHRSTVPFFNLSLSYKLFK